MGLPNAVLALAYVIASAMAAHGARVVISSRKTDACDAVAAEINAACEAGPGEALSIPAHIGEKDQLEQLVTKTREAWGQIDILVCNAGYRGGGNERQEINGIEKHFPGSTSGGGHGRSPLHSR